MNRRTILAGLPAIALAACGKSNSSKLKLALNWKPEPEFGGFYAADYAKHGLNVEVLPGGAGTPTVQMIGSATTDFGVISADELILARSNGNDVVALFATFQNCPLGIMAHASRHLQSIGDVLKGGTLALQRGMPYARILEKKYGFDKVKIVPSTGGDLSAFLRDENFAQQCFITSEPLAARKKGVAVTVFPVSDIGYNPYTAVVACSGGLLKGKPDTCAAMVAAVREGWRAYLDNPTAANKRMNQLNPSMDAETFAEVAVAERPFIEAPVLGTMTAERWETLIQQLKDLGDIKVALPATECFRA